MSSENFTKTETYCPKNNTRYISGIMKTYEVIRKIRTEKGMSARSIARALGMYPSSYSALEQGERSVKADELHIIARALGVSAADLLEPAVPPASGDREGVRLPGGIVLSRKDADVWEAALYGMTEEEVRRVGECIAAYSQAPPARRQDALAALAVLFRSLGTGSGIGSGATGDG